MAADFKVGIPADSLRDGEMVAGNVGEDEVVLVRKGEQFFAIGAHCTHYGGTLAEGLVVGSTVRCPLHHACFDLATGEALRAPAFNPIPCWRVERQGNTVFVHDKLPEQKSSAARLSGTAPSSIVIIGGGAAGFAAADMLRREAYEGPITMLSADDNPPVDRPNLSKDYLAGEAQEDWIPLWPRELFAERRIDLVLRARVASIDCAKKTVVLEDGSRRDFGALLIATGAEPRRLPIPGADTANVFYLRTLDDSSAIIKRAESAKRALVVGSSFIGLEVAASLRKRNIAIDVVSPDKLPLARVMGPELGQFIQKLHEAHGVKFHLGQTVASIQRSKVTLSGGASLEADFVVIGAGVRPLTEIAERSGIATDRGVTVNEFLETSASGVYAAGDIARWPDPHTGERIRVEHWVVAERQGQTAARNMLGARERFDAVPYFWSQHYDVTIRYVGHVEHWDSIEVNGSLEAHDATVTYLKGGRRLAVATISRDRASLEAEVALEASHKH